MILHGSENMPWFGKDAFIVIAILVGWVLLFVIGGFKELHRWKTVQQWLVSMANLSLTLFVFIAGKCSNHKPAVLSHFNETETNDPHHALKVNKNFNSSTLNSVAN